MQMRDGALSLGAARPSRHAPTLSPCRKPGSHRSKEVKPMSLKENLDWGEKAVAEVRRYVQYSANNLKADLVASWLPRMEFDKLRNLEAAKAAKQASIVGDQASV